MKREREGGGGRQFPPKGEKQKKKKKKKNTWARFQISGTQPILAYADVTVYIFDI